MGGRDERRLPGRRPALPLLGLHEHLAEAGPPIGAVMRPVRIPRLLTDSLLHRDTVGVALFTLTLRVIHGVSHLLLCWRQRDRCRHISSSTAVSATSTDRPLVLGWSARSSAW